MSFRRDDGTEAKLVGSRIEVMMNGQRSIIPLNKVDRRRLAEFMHARGFKRVDN